MSVRDKLTTQVAAVAEREAPHSVERFCACGEPAPWHVSGGKGAGFYCDACVPKDWAR